MKNNITNGSLNKWQPHFWTTERRRTLALLNSGLQKADGIITLDQETQRAKRLAQLSELLNGLESGLQILQYKLQEALNTCLQDIEAQLAERGNSTKDTDGIK